MMSDEEVKELNRLTQKLNDSPLTATEATMNEYYEQQLKHRALIKRSTIDDIEDGIADIEEIMKDCGDLVKFICIRAINKLEKAKRQVRDGL